MKSPSLSLMLAAGMVCGSCGGGVSGPGGTPPILGSCDLQPNYVSQVILNRWREFPLRYHLVESTLPVEDRDRIRQRIVEGVHQWAVATNQRLGSLVAVADPDDADFLVLVEDLDMVFAARTTHATGSPFLSGGRIVLDEETVIRLAELDEELLTALVGHEMGHLLGIIGHPLLEGVLMTVPLQTRQPTTADVNTMSHAYCR